MRRDLLQGQMEESAATLRDLRQRQSEAESQVISADAALAEVDDQLREVERRRSDLRSRIASLDSTVRHQASREEELKSDLQRLVRQQGLMKNRVTEAEAEENTKRAPRFDPKKYLVELGVSPDLAADWIEHRKSVKAKPSKTAIEGIAKEAEKAQMSLSDALRESCSRGWRGFKAEWMENKTQNARASPSGQSWHDRQAETIAILTGRNKPNESERDITGEARRVA